MNSCFFWKEKRTWGLGSGIVGSEVCIREGGVGGGGQQPSPPQEDPTIVFIHRYIQISIYPYQLISSSFYNIFDNIFWFWGFNSVSSNFCVFGRFSHDLVWVSCFVYLWSLDLGTTFRVRGQDLVPMCEVKRCSRSIIHPSCYQE